MTIAADARYRSILVSFTNNAQDGSEFVQLLAKPSGGAWAAQRTFPVALTTDQEMTWATALPLTLYSIALRYMIGSVPAVGYESSNPDSWTSPHAAGSKGTLTTACGLVTSLAASAFVDAATPITLTWGCTQLAVPFLLEKNIGAGWVTVVADLVATSYQYTIPGAELGGTTSFRVTPKRGAVAGTTSDTVAVLMAIVIGTPIITTSTFNASNGQVSLAWTPASQATLYLMEKSANNGASWATIGSIPDLSYVLTINVAEVNLNMQYRVTGTNGASHGTPSTPAVVPTTITITPPVASIEYDTPSAGYDTMSWTAAPGAQGIGSFVVKNSFFPVGRTSSGPGANADIMPPAIVAFYDFGFVRAVVNLADGPYYVESNHVALK